MAYIVQRNNQFYVVAYNGVDPHTGKERRRWHPAGRSREDAEAIATRLGADRDTAQARAIGSVTVETFLIDDWLPPTAPRTPPVHRTTLRVVHRQLHRTSDRTASIEQPASRASRPALP